MNIRTKLTVVCAVLALGAACGDGTSSKNNGNNGASNNGASNNGASNNGASNNGASNNGASNNGASNNGASNNGASNNGATNNGTTGTNNSTNNGTTGTNNSTNNGTTGTNNGTTGTNNGTNGTNNGTNGTNNGTNGMPQACNGSFGAADACGGDPTGNWTLDEICSDYDLTAAAQQACAGATVSNAMYTGTGSLVVAGAAWALDIDASVTADVAIPASCNILGCNQTATFIETTGGASSATCVDANGGGCDCDVTYDVSNTSAGTYTTDGAGTATVNSGETYYYCVSGGTLQLREYGTNNDEALPTYLTSN